MPVVGLLAALCLVIFGVAYCSPTALISGDDQTPAKSEEDPTDLLHSNKFNAANPKYLSAVRSLVAMSGFECPALAMVWLKGETPYGVKLDVLCGPNDGTGNGIPNLHYAVYPEKFRVHVCQPFGIIPHDCS